MGATNDHHRPLLSGILVKIAREGRGPASVHLDWNAHRPGDAQL